MSLAVSAQVQNQQHSNMLTILKGYRTYICAFIVALIAVLHYFGVIDSNLYPSLIGLFGSGAIAALRAAVPSTTTQ